MNNTTQQQEAFNPREHLIELRSKQGTQEYLPVQWRLVWFREVCPQGEIITELVELDLDREMAVEGYVWNNETRRSEKIVKKAKGYALFKATVKDGKGGSATGYKSENAASFAEFTEKAETGAIGRALAALGYGTQFAPELDEEHRIVDAPVDRAATPGVPATASTVKPNVTMKQTANEVLMNGPASPQQLASISKLRAALQMTEIQRDLTYKDAKDEIATLSHEYNERKAQAQKAKAS